MQVDVIIVGAGAAGMMCAAQAGARGRSVLLIDHTSKLGERIRISGGGRCNFTNRQVSPANYLSQNPHFCRSALSRFTQQDFIAMVKARRIRFHERDHGQLFCDDSAQQIIDMLRDACDDAGVHWALGTKVTAVRALAQPAPAQDIATAPPPSTGTAIAQTGEPGFIVDTVGADGKTRQHQCTSLVVATGGLAIPQIGASPWGYKLAEQFGLPIVPPKPALVPLALAPELLQGLQPMAGSTLDAVAQFGDTGFRENVLITHRGLSGPAILQISSYWQMQEYRPSKLGKGSGKGSDKDIGKSKAERPAEPAHEPAASLAVEAAKKQPITINLLPDLDVDAWIESHREGRHSRVLLPNLLSEHLPKRFAQQWCEQVGGERWLSRPIGELSKRDLAQAALALQAWPLMPSGTLGYAKAEVTLGGVSTDALSSKTMQAKQVPGLYFIGEVVDVTGWLGGYNFQWAWSSGWVAGQAV